MSSFTPRRTAFAPDAFFASLEAGGDGHDQQLTGWRADVQRIAGRHAGRHGDTHPHRFRLGGRGDARRSNARTNRGRGGEEGVGRESEPEHVHVCALLGRVDDVWPKGWIDDRRTLASSVPKRANAVRRDSAAAQGESGTSGERGRLAPGESSSSEKE